jgi:hypothetical protein
VALKNRTFYYAGEYVDLIAAVTHGEGDGEPDHGEGRRDGQTAGILKSLSTCPLFFVITLEPRVERCKSL